MALFSKLFQAAEFCQCHLVALEGAIKTLKERNVELLKSMEELSQMNSQLKEALTKKPNRDENFFNCIVLRSQISKLRQEKEAADDEIAGLRTQLAAEQSKNATSADAVKEEITSRDSTPELRNVATSITQYDGNNNPQNLLATAVNTVTDEVLSSGSAVVPKGLKKLTTYFRSLEDHGLSPEEIVEYLRRKYPYMANNLFSLMQVVVAKDCYRDA
ncbi:hypothetical protein AAVH_17560 [Aphelenchoides avenae]|nr:hypothetical protein AAVH_17560 [Aphelenchus avenae]